MEKKVKIVKEMVANGYFLGDRTIEGLAAAFDEETLKMFLESFLKYKKEN